jgi:hypothetical protein
LSPARKSLLCKKPHFIGPPVFGGPIILAGQRVFKEKRNTIPLLAKIPTNKRCQKLNSINPFSKN